MKLKDFKLLTEQWNKYVNEEEGGCDWGPNDVPNDKCKAGDELVFTGEDGVATKYRVLVNKEGEKKTWIANRFTNPEWAEDIEKLTEEGWDIGSDSETEEEAAEEETAEEAEDVPGAAPTENLARQIVQTLQLHLVQYAGAPEVQPGTAGSPKGGGENFIDGKFGPLTRKWLRSALNKPTITDSEELVYIPPHEEEKEEQ